MTDTHGTHSRASFRLREPQLGTLDVAVEWLRDHWDGQREAPIRLHESHTTDGALGGLRYSGAFLATISWVPGQVREMTATAICAHPMVNGRAEDCPECQGTGATERANDRFVHPMTMALSQLAKIVTTPSEPHPVAVILTLAHHGWRLRSVAQVLGLANVDAVVLRSIRQLHGRYQAGPVSNTPAWTQLSESQQNAVLQGEAA